MLLGFQVFLENKRKVGANTDLRSLHVSVWRRQINVSKKPSFVAFLILKSGHDSGIRTRDLSAFRVRTNAPPVAGSLRGICWQLRAVPRGQSGRKALWARARARARSPYNHGTHPLTKSAERRVSAAPRTMQARLTLRRCASARRWLLQVGAHAERRSLVREGTPVRRRRSCAPRSARDGLGRLAASVKRGRMGRFAIGVFVTAALY